MTILLHNDLNVMPVKRQFDKVLNNLQKNDFKSADVKKMVGTAYYRAKLDDTHRLLFQFGRYNEQTYLLILEVIMNHDYANSRFLRGAVVDETKLYALRTEKDIKEALPPISHVNTQTGRFHLLDKILSFDSVQNEVYQMPLPIIMIGSAGSGKTALTLEKMKLLRGHILYVTLSDFLKDNARQLYHSFDYQNPNQNVTFLSFKEYVSTIQTVEGVEMTYKLFDKWIYKYQHTYKIRNSYKVFEEFKGVITGSCIEKAYLSKEEYIDLGIKQSIFLKEERSGIYELFLKYLSFLKEKSYYDLNIEAYKNLSKAKSRYDYVVIDEVQDLTNVQLFLILKSLKEMGHFVMCGDANQVVHPNFFSWTSLKSLFYQQNCTSNKDIVRILGTNYRNTPEVTAIANQLLLVKNARFGSIDRESTYLVKANSATQGETIFYEDTPSVKKELNQNTCRSTKFAVLVMRPEDKLEASKYFDTPLIFSVQEAKGLEYENIILYNIISNHEKAFRELTTGVTKQDLHNDLVYHRNRDKTDKSHEVYKFYINSLYVAVTRAVKNLYVIEKVKKHALLELLDLTHFRQSVNMVGHSSTLEDWQNEAQKLDKQGKQDQADAIRNAILNEQKASGDIITFDQLQILKAEALNPEVYHKKAKDQLFEFAAYYDDIFWMPELAKLKYKHAQTTYIIREQKAFLRHTLNDYYHDNLNALKPFYQEYGVNFRNNANMTPLMLATMTGASHVAEYLIANGADLKAVNSFGLTAFQMALQYSVTDPQYAKTSLSKMYSLLKPSELKLKMSNQILICDDGDGLFLMVNLIIATLRHKLTRIYRHKLPFANTNDFLEVFKSYPPSVIAQYRCQRVYINNIFSKNVLGRKSKNNWMIFFRISKGQYLLNPTIEVEVGDDEWMNIYELAGLTEISLGEQGFFSELAKNIQSMSVTFTKILEESLQEIEAQRLQSAGNPPLV
jgi:AAA domain/Ankyrin repeats (many copies)